MKKSIPIILFALAFSLLTNTLRAQTFEWETATESGGVVSETVDGVTVTVSSSTETMVKMYINGIAGASGWAILAESSITNFVEFSFSQAVDISTIYAIDQDGNNGGTWTYTPTGTSTSTVDDNISTLEGHTVTLNWINITSFTVTKPSAFSGGFAFDKLICSEASLPVELTSFTGIVTANKVTLNWQTATEVNNYGFEVERQILNQVQNDSESWEKVGFVEGHGNSNSPKEYSFVDKNPISGKSHYRLKQIDIDGKFEYSDIVEVEISIPTKFELSQNYPNPFNPSTRINYQLSKPLKVSLVIYDVFGKEVTTLVNKQQASGNYEVTFDASRYASGVYFYRLSTGNGYTNTKKMQLLK